MKLKNTLGLVIVEVLKGTKKTPGRKVVVSTPLYTRYFSLWGGYEDVAITPYVYDEIYSEYTDNSPPAKMESHCLMVAGRVMVNLGHHLSMMGLQDHYVSLNLWKNLTSWASFAKSYPESGEWKGKNKPYDTLPDGTKTYELRPHQTLYGLSPLKCLESMFENRRGTPNFEFDQFPNGKGMLRMVGRKCY